MISGLKSIEIDIGLYYFCNYCPQLKKINPSTPKPLNIDIGQSLLSNGTIESPKKNGARATLLLSNLAKFDKSNVARAPFYFGLSMVPLLKSDCPISIFNGLGGHGLSFFILGQLLHL